MTDRIRIAVVQSTVPDYRVPIVRRMVEEADADVSVFTTPGGDWVTARQTAHIEGIPGVTVVPAKLTRLPGLTLIRYGGLRKLLRQRGADVVIAEPRMGLLTILGLAFFPLRKNGRRVPIVWWMAGWRNTARAAWIVKLADAVEWIIVRRGGAAGCYGSRAAERAVRLGIPREAVRVAQNSIDTTELEAAVAARRAAAPSPAPAGRGLRLIFIGQILERKRLDLVLRSMAEGGPACRESTLRVIGSGPDVERLKGLVRQYGLDARVEWIGHTTDPERLAEHLVWADVGVLPHAGGLMLNTCMAAALPTLCGEADGTEVDLVVHDKTGWLFEGQNWQVVASLLETAGSRRADLPAIGAAAFAHLKATATPQRVINALVEAAKVAWASTS